MLGDFERVISTLSVMSSQRSSGLVHELVADPLAPLFWLVDGRTLVAQDGVELPLGRLLYHGGWWRRAECM